MSLSKINKSTYETRSNYSYRNKIKSMIFSKSSSVRSNLVSPGEQPVVSAVISRSPSPVDAEEYTENERDGNAESGRVQEVTVVLRPRPVDTENGT